MCSVREEISRADWTDSCPHFYRKEVQDTLENIDNFQHLPVRGEFRETTRMKEEGYSIYILRTRNNEVDPVRRTSIIFSHDPLTALSRAIPL